MHFPSLNSTRFKPVLLRPLSIPPEGKKGWHEYLWIAKSLLATQLVYQTKGKTDFSCYPYVKC